MRKANQMEVFYCRLTADLFLSSQPLTKGDFYLFALSDAFLGS